MINVSLILKLEIDIILSKPETKNKLGNDENNNNSNNNNNNNNNFKSVY